MSPQDRSNEIRKQRLCINCFSKTHSLANCTSKFTCSHCSNKHHTLRNFGAINFSNSLNPNSTPFVSNSLIQSTTVQTCFSTSSQGVLLGTVIVQLWQLGCRYNFRALIDSGSEGTFISERSFKLLKLPSTSTNAKISGLNNSVSANANKQCSILLGSSRDPDLQISTSALVVPQLSGNLPSTSLPKNVLDNLPAIPLADPHFYKDSNIDILLGGDVFPSIMLNGHINKVCGSLLAQETIFGWILTGPFSSYSSNCPTTTVSFHCGVTLQDEISKFWVVENLPRKNFISKADKFCDEVNEKTTTRDEQGRYMVSLTSLQRNRS